MSVEEKKSCCKRSCITGTLPNFVKVIFVNGDGNAGKWLKVSKRKSLKNKYLRKPFEDDRKKTFFFFSYPGKSVYFL
jgi:hypothetical protein